MVDEGYNYEDVLNALMHGFLTCLDNFGCISVYSQYHPIALLSSLNIDELEEEKLNDLKSFYQDDLNGLIKNNIHPIACAWAFLGVTKQITRRVFNYQKSNEIQDVMIKAINRVQN